MRKLYSILFLMALASCSKNETETPAENKAPLAFTVSVSELTTRSTQLNWLEAKDPEGKKVTYSVELNNQTIASNLSATGYKLENLAANAAYSGKIIASDPAGNKTSGAFSFSTTDHPQPSDFILSAENVTSKSISLSWSASTLPDNSPVTYDVLVNSVLAAPSLTTTRYEIYTLAPKKTYQFKVVAKAASGKSREKVIPVETKENALPAAFTITQNAYGFSYITFTCNKTTDTDNDPLTYYLVRNGVETQLLATNPAANFSYTLKNLSAATNYTLAVKVKDGRGGETTSNTLTYKNKCSPGKQLCHYGKIGR